MQIFGGMGMTWESRAHVWLRRAQVDRPLFGDENAQYQQLADAQLGPRPEGEPGEGLTAAWTTPTPTTSISSALGFVPGYATTGAASGATTGMPPTRPPRRSSGTGHSPRRATSRSRCPSNTVARACPTSSRRLKRGAGGRRRAASAADRSHRARTRRLRQPGAEEPLLPGLLSCAEPWCQGFSEPGAGSDLAGITTAAIATKPGGRTFRVNGRKIWTSGAMWSRWCLLLVRTEPGQERHRGLSMIVVGLDTPGVERREIAMLNRQPGVRRGLLRRRRGSRGQPGRRPRAGLGHRDADAVL